MRLLDRMSSDVATQDTLLLEAHPIDAIVSFVKQAADGFTLTMTSSPVESSYSEPNASAIVLKLVDTLLAKRAEWRFSSANTTSTSTSTSLSIVTRLWSIVDEVVFAAAAANGQTASSGGADSFYVENANMVGEMVSNSDLDSSLVFPRNEQLADVVGERVRLRLSRASEAQRFFFLVYRNLGDAVNAGESHSVPAEQAALVVNSNIVAFRTNSHQTDEQDGELAG